MSDYRRRQIKYCRRCKYHGILSVVRGHKGSCNFNTCDCSNCSQLPPPVLGKRKPTRHVKIGGIVESKEDQIMVDAWINGEDVEDDGSVEKADQNDVDFLPNAEPQKTATVASTVASSGKTVKLPVALMRALAAQQTSPAELHVGAKKFYLFVAVVDGLSMTSIIFLLYACGLLNNAFLFFWVYNSWSTPKRLNRIVLVQLFLNTWNIIAHAAVEFSKQHFWIVLATSLSFFSNYLLAAVVLSTSLGRPMQQRLKSKTNIVICALISSILLVSYGRRYKHCETGNCFSPNLAKTEDKLAILKSDITAFYSPTAVIFFGSWYLGLRSCNRMVIKKRAWNCKKRLSLFFSKIAVSLFLLYGLFVIDGILYFNEDGEISMANHLCRMGCLHEELYVLLSMFPAYMCIFIKQNEEKQLRDEI